MISQKQFQKLNQERWGKTKQLSDRVKNKGDLSPQEARILPAYFRKVCQEVGIARERLYGVNLTNNLNNLVMSLFHHIYRSKSKLSPLRFITHTFPGAFKHNLHFFWVSFLLFWLPFCLLAFSGNWGLEWIQSLLGPQGMANMDIMYGKDGDVLAHGRETHGSDFMMFCFYVWNNVSIDFRCYGGGILYGIGTLFFTVYNGLMIGAAAGYVHAVGDPQKFWGFVCGHSAFELIGIHLASAAGFRLGWGLIAPGNQTRSAALLRSAKHSLVILGGAAILTFLAAIIEGFWSAHPHPLPLKYTVGIVLWVLTFAYLFSGRKEWYERP